MDTRVIRYQAKSGKWYDLEVANLIDTFNDKYVDLTTLIKEDEVFKSSCICMDCGKVIKTREQNKHLSECPNDKSNNVEFSKGENNGG